MSNDTLKIGAVLHGNKDYTIKRVLGQGGFGITYEATAPFTDGNIRQKMHYAIKEFFMDEVCCRKNDVVVPIEGQEGKFSTYLDNFVNEAKRMRNICKHPGIASVNEVFRDGGTSYYVMEFLDGQTLEEAVKCRGAFSEETTVKFIRHVGNALSFIHSERMNHFDVKPGNIILVVDEHGQECPVLIDFGLSRHFNKSGSPTSMYSTLGCSDGYSPIEQYAGIERFSPEADVYALAATAVFMLTGKAPCRSVEMNEQWLRSNLPTTISQSMQSALIHALRPSAKERCQSVEAFLEQLVARENVQTPTPSEPIDPSATRVIEPSRDRLSWAKTSKNGGIKKVIYTLTVIGVVAVCATIGYFAAGMLSHETKTVVDAAETNGTIIEVTQPIEPDTVQSKLDLGYADYEGWVKDGKPHGAGILIYKVVHQIDSSDANMQTAEPGDTLIGSFSEGLLVAGKWEIHRKPKLQQSQAGSNPSPRKLDLGYAVYEGAMKSRLPHGRGVLTFKESHQIESRDPEKRMASPGDIVEGQFSEGHLTQGTWKKADGTTSRIMLGAI